MRTPKALCMAFCAVFAAVVGAGCGGGEQPEPDLTLVFYMREYDETNAFLERMELLAANDLVPIRIECGLEDGLKMPPGQVPIHLDGYAPRLTFMTFPAGEARRAQHVALWLAVYDAAEWKSSDPFDCGPLPTRN